MGLNGALKAQQILDNAHGILGVECIAAAQALDFRDHATGAGTRAAHAAIRNVVEHLDVDRPLYNDHNAMAAAVKRCDILDAVEGSVGELASSWET
jgi:histidine ammonia-lyase